MSVETHTPLPEAMAPAVERAIHRHTMLFKRNPANPVLSASQWPYQANSVFNPGATRLKDGTTLLLVRVEDHRGHSHFDVARSRDGVSDWDIHPAPAMLPDPVNHPEELWGIEDPRITFVPELGKYAVVYTAYSWGGPSVSLALTEDFKKFERLGVTHPPEDKDAALLPRRIKGRWAMIHRPVGHFGAHIWISYSPDLRHWGGHKLILEARRGGWWDANKIGLSPPLIETPKGWLMIYHGVRVTAGGALYRLGLALLDLEEPETCLARGDMWVFGPEQPYERGGDVQNVVFPCGTTLGDDGDTINMYYGAADTTVALAHGSLNEIMGWLRHHSLPARSGTTH